ncbi:MAG: hypothetical protein IJ936_04205 [Peptococcaceae bacterium]|nr:hypothetical protein [Peptococcaceae bacterium]
MKKVLMAFLTIVMLLSLAGCGSASKPEATVGEFCEALKTLDMETASSCFASGNSGLKNPYAEGNTEKQNIFTEQAVAYFTNCVNEMTYTVGEPAIEGDKAVVPVTFTYVDAGPVVSAALEEYLPQAFMLSFSSVDDSVVKDLFDTIFAEKVETVSTETATVTVEFVCVKQEKEWKLQGLNDTVRHEINNILSCNITKDSDLNSAMTALGVQNQLKNAFGQMYQQYKQ